MGATAEMLGVVAPPPAPPFTTKLSPGTPAAPGPINLIRPPPPPPPPRRTPIPPFPPLARTTAPVPRLRPLELQLRITMPPPPPPDPPNSVVASTALPPLASMEAPFPRVKPVAARIAIVPPPTPGVRPLPIPPPPPPFLGVWKIDAAAPGLRAAAAAATPVVPAEAAGPLVMPMILARTPRGTEYQLLVTIRAFVPMVKEPEQRMVTPLGTVSV